MTVNLVSSLLKKVALREALLRHSLFITYNWDMGSSLSGCISHFFADELAGIMSGELGINCLSQYLDLENRGEVFLDQLEYYSSLTD